MKKIDEVEENTKKNKKKVILIGGGIVLVAGAFLIRKKIGKGATVAQPISEGVSDICDQIYEDVANDMAMEVYNALIDSGIDTFHLDRSFEVEDGVFKTIKVVMETTKK